MKLLMLTEREASAIRRTFAVGAHKFEASVIILCLVLSRLCHSNKVCPLQLRALNDIFRIKMVI